MSVVVDTNVAIVAEELADHADQTCVDACIDRLLAVMDSGGLLLDEDDAIVEEYTKTLGHSGRPGVGRAFAKWAFDYRFDEDRCNLVAITVRLNDGWRRYDEFPDSPALSKFDPDDQKFVAVAVASGIAPSILNAVDSDWWIHREALSAAGVTVDFLCRHLLANG
ncbi:MAG: hypothetical protein ABSD28_06695 [Tepidisphaeraceae bacterium]